MDRFLREGELGLTHEDLRVRRVERVFYYDLCRVVAKIKKIKEEEA